MKKRMTREREREKEKKEMRRGDDVKEREREREGEGDLRSVAAFMNLQNSRNCLRFCFLTHSVC